MLSLTINLHKRTSGDIVTFPAALLRYSERERVVRAEWTRARLDLGYLVFEPGDTLIEHYYSDRWYTIFAIYSCGDDQDLEQRPLFPGSERDHIQRSALPPWVTPANHKGWYCNIARPASFDLTSITSEDLAIDLFVSPDRTQLLTLDMDEYELLDLAVVEPAAHTAALAALAELQQLALTGTEPFV